MRPAVIALGLLLVWPLAAFGGVYWWGAAATAAGAAALAIAIRPAVARSAETRTLDLALAAALAATLLQAIPLPSAFVTRVSPGAAAMGEALRLRVPGAPPPAFTTLSIDPAATWQALLVAATAVVVFWSARALFRTGGLRATARTTAIAGALAAATGILLAAAGTREVYGFWTPRDPGARPFGPFVDRNHFATWMAMAVPFVCGYLLARIPPRRPADPRPWRARMADVVDGRMIWLLGSTAVMIAALVA
ncbi:MAG TPA: hypothetical protein VNI83_03035, partial [Vicinamibacterales bacterium]|nr:hypothetical protein [Vicinamibacterales bacterium]